MNELVVGLQRILGSVLAFFFDLAPSFGISIILVTLTANLLAFPLTLKQTRSTRAFQRVQPEIKRIQKEHADDRDRMQQELARAQRDAGATPAGCLFPILIQLAIWFALYRPEDSHTRVRESNLDNNSVTATGFAGCRRGSMVRDEESMAAPAFAQEPSVILTSSRVILPPSNS